MSDNAVKLMHDIEYELNLMIERNIPDNSVNVIINDTSTSPIERSNIKVAVEKKNYTVDIELWFEEMLSDIPIITMTEKHISSIELPNKMKLESSSANMHQVMLFPADQNSIQLIVQFIKKSIFGFEKFYQVITNRGIILANKILTTYESFIIESIGFGLYSQQYKPMIEYVDSDVAVVPFPRAFFFKCKRPELLFNVKLEIADAQVERKEYLKNLTYHRTNS